VKYSGRRNALDAFYHLVASHEHFIAFNSTLFTGFLQEVKTNMILRPFHKIANFTLKMSDFTISA